MTTTAPRRVAWHALGTILPEGTTSAEEALILSGLAGWNVRKRELYAANGALVSGKYATVRDTPDGGEEVLGVVGDRFEIIQNEAHIELLDTFADEVGATFDSAGTTTGGAETFISMKLPSYFAVGGEDAHDMYVTALNSHVGSRSFTFLVTPVRLICTNMQSAALRSRSNVRRVRHTSGAPRAVAQEARRLADDTFAYIEDFLGVANRLANTPMTVGEFEDLVRDVFGTASKAPHVMARADNKVETLVRLFVEAETQNAIRNTAWAAYNAFSEYQDHFAETRGGDPARARALSSVLAPSLKAKALKLVC